MKRVGWEDVEDGRGREGRLQRIEVPGGWLYRLDELGDLGGLLFQSLVFVPRPRSGDEAGS
jgi:hypothetical protein